MVQPNVILLDNCDKIFRIVRPAEKEYFPEQVILDSSSQPLMLSRSAFHSLGMKKFDVDKCPF
jgi:hypothetical protein